MKPKKLRGYAGTRETWEVYKTHLEIVSRMNGWDEDETALHFSAELSGSALEYYGSLDNEDRVDYVRLLKAMGQRFGTMTNQEAVRSQLDNIQQKAGQSLQDLGQKVRGLAYAVYVSDTTERRERESVHAFMCAISSREVVQALVHT